MLKHPAKPHRLKGATLTPSQLKFTRTGQCPKGTGALVVQSLSNTETDQCIPWPYSTDDWGYGTVLYKGHVTKTHRVAWMMHHGEIEKGLKVCHTCDNPPCINIRHLFLGTDADNMLDCVRKGRHRDCKGSKNPHAVLTETQVRKIRATYRRGVRGFGTHVLARQYCVNKTTIRYIVERKSWRSLL